MVLKLLALDNLGVLPVYGLVGPLWKKWKLLQMLVPDKFAPFLKQPPPETSGARLLGFRFKRGNIFSRIAKHLKYIKGLQPVILGIAEGLAVSDAIEATRKDDKLWGVKGTGCTDECGHLR